MTKDLVVLAADKNIQQVLGGLFERPQALDIRPIQFDVLVHPQHDPACALRGVEFLSNFSEQYRDGLDSNRRFVNGWSIGDGFSKPRISLSGPRRRLRPHYAKPEFRVVHPFTAISRRRFR